ncbi:glycosyltransferase [Portibacter lacus]|uniref:Glycosyl transferase family 2 n=1 Tax=Portibacter lacus TaxID=1099794 RepID=A0AA37SSA1_9BACT|nr:glycosyltransferase [Portibacter lacus]GLR19012.1 glycosyl transferase family 2 [Portibacter lacus]
MYFSQNTLHISNEFNIKTPVSIIICVKNEADNILLNFDSWVGQCTTSGDKLILVDDFSTDKTFEILLQKTQPYDFCKCIKSSKDRPGKKQALSDGIHAATNDYIVVTDADCSLPINWKSKLIAHVEPKTDFVLGYAPFYKKPGFLNLFQRFECTMTALQYTSYANAGNPYMGVGRNMLFRKSIFDPTIFEDQIASGDDDILVSSFAVRENTKVCLDTESFVYSESPSTLKEYWKQKLRHISSSQKYRPKTIFLLSLFSTSHILFPFLFIALLFSMFWKIALILFAIRLLLISIVLKKTEKILKEEGLFNFSPILDITLSIYYLLLSFTYPFKNKKSWN